MNKFLFPSHLGYSIYFFENTVEIGCSEFTWNEVESMLVAIKERKPHPLIVEIGYRLIRHENGVFPLSYVQDFEELFERAKKFKNSI